MVSKTRMQSLILEVLNAQPSLRDSKTYLNSFAPRKSNRTSNNKNDSNRSSKKDESNLTFTSPQRNPNHWNKSQEKEQQQPFIPTAHFPLPPHHLPSTSASTPNSPIQITTSSTSLPNISLSDTVETVSSSPIQQHTALVKVQGPFTSRQLTSIADGLVYLKKLGLVSVIVMDSEDWMNDSPRFGAQDGEWMKEGGEESEDGGGIEPWLSSNNHGNDRVQSLKSMGKRKQVFEREGEGERRRNRTMASLRKRMLMDTYRLAELLNEKGANALPFGRPIMKVDCQEARKAHDEWGEARDKDLDPSSTQSATTSSDFQFDLRSPLTSDDNLSSLRTTLSLNQIPILAPFAIYSDPEKNGAERNVPVRADDLMVGLARDMANAGRRDESRLNEDGEVGLDENDVDMTPLRLMVM